MKYMILDGNMIQSREHLHEILARELELPTWYGRNLDALYDCLTDRFEDTLISVVNLEQLSDELQQYCGKLLRVLRDSAEENPHLHLNIV